MLFNPRYFIWFGCALLAAGSVAAQSGRLSVSERVTKLESQMQAGNGQALVELQNRLDALQAEVQSLRGLNEQQAFQIEELKKRARDQYVDLDSRISQLEGTQKAAVRSGAMPTGTALSAGATQPLLATPAAPGQLTMETTANAGSAPSANVDSGVASEASAALATPSDVAATAAAPTADMVAGAAAQGDEQSAYDMAFAALREGRYAESARRFSGFLEQYPNGDLADNGLYWLGESYYVTQNYAVALDTFKTLLARFPQSAKAPDALLKLGYCHYELHEWNAAEAALNQVIQNYPETTVARLAQGRLRALRLEGKTP